MEEIIYKTEDRIASLQAAGAVVIGTIVPPDHISLDKEPRIIIACERCYQPRDSDLNCPSCRSHRLARSLATLRQTVDKLAVELSKAAQSVEP